MDNSKIIKEIHIDNKDPEEFRNIVKTYNKEFYKDKHKVYIDYKLKAGCIALPYIVLRNKENNEVMGYTSFEVFKVKENMFIETHCLCVRPNYRGLKLSELMLRELESAIINKYGKLYCGTETCNEISAKSYKRLGWEETGSYRMSKDGERVLIKLKKFYS